MRMALLGLLVAAAGWGQVSVAECRQVRRASHYKGRFGWEDAPQRALVGASERLSVGEAILACTLSFSRFDMGRVRISFDGPSDGLGVVLEVRSGKELVYSESMLRVAGESWIEIDARMRNLPGKGSVFLLRLVDPSSDTGMRVDLGPLTIR